jgi:ER-bound oxygenase mpaB/B'/Rubber oxygenase, catalytic domain
MARYSRLRQIQELDPEHDYQEIYRLSTEYEFPWDVTRALELALFRTYAVPSIGGLLDRTREFTDRGQKRYDDTVVLLYEMTRDGGMDSPRGRAAVRRMNRIHGRYPISNDDFLYVLSTFVVVPVRWIAEYGWRPYSRHEVRATVNTFRHMGRLMGLKDIPETYEEFAALLDGYEREHYAFNEPSRRVAEATIAIFQGWFPGFARPLARSGVLALTDAPLREALGLRRSPRALEVTADRALRARALLVRMMPARPDSLPKKPRPRTYRNGYTLGEIGPDWARERAARTG